jgi:competence protein ComEA
MPAARTFTPGRTDRPRHGAPPAWPERLRWDPGRRGVLALGGAVVVVVVVLAWWLARSRPHELPVSSVGPPAAAPASGPARSGGTVPSPGASAAVSSPEAAAPTGASNAATIVVDVAGKVRRPGIYQLRSGARVYDALQAAGGARTGVSTVALNLAAPLQDGQQVVVGQPAAAGSVPGAPAGSPGAAGPAPTAPIDVNTASLEQLESLPGVGPVLAQNILDWRNAHGRFASVDQLRQVTGIGDVRLAQLRPLVSV